MFESTPKQQSLIQQSKKPTGAFRYICQILANDGCAVTRIEHAPVSTIEEADRVCPDANQGIKVLLLSSKGHPRPILAIIAGHDRLDTHKVRALVGCKVSFVDPGQACELMECDPWSIPPLTPVEVTTIIDPKIFEFHSVYFNPGANNCTIGIEGTTFRRLLDARQALSGDICRVAHAP